MKVTKKMADGVECSIECSEFVITNVDGQDFDVPIVVKESGKGLIRFEIGVREGAIMFFEPVALNKMQIGVFDDMS